jgi:hypothetical protein
MRPGTRDQKCRLLAAKYLEKFEKSVKLHIGIKEALDISGETYPLVLD